MRVSTNFALPLAVLLFVSMFISQSVLAGAVTNCPVEPTSGVAIASGDTYAGTNCTLNTANDTDSFQFNANSGDVWYVATGFKSGSQNICLKLYDPNLKNIFSGCSNINFSNQSVGTVQNLTVTGTYTIDISEATAGTLNYGLNLERISPLPTDANNLALDTAVTGNIAAASDSNVFTFTGATTGLYQVSATLAATITSNLCITVYASNGSLVTASSGSNQGCSNINFNNYSDSLQFTPTTNGTYLALLTVGGNAGTASYTLEASCAAGYCQPQSANQTITFGPAPTDVVVGGIGTVSAIGGPSGNPVILTSVTTGVCTVNGSTVTGLAAGTCTIDANQAGNANYNAATQVTQSFNILVSQTIPGRVVVDCPVEPVSGVPIASGVTYAGINCTLNTANDSDSFQFNANSGDVWYVATGFKSGTQNICLNLYDPNHKNIYSGCSNLNFSNQSVATVQSLTATGTYTIDISEATAGTLNYGVNLERISPTPTDANNLALNTSVIGNIAVASDSNAFVFTGATTGLYQVSATLAAPITSNLCISVYASNGSLVTTSSGSNQGCSNINFSNYSDSIQFTPTTNGTYLALLTVGGNAGTASYNLEVSCAAGTCPSSSLLPQTITFGTAPTVVVGGTGTVSATGGASGNPVTFSSTTTSVCTTSGTNGSTVTGVTVGTCIIAANQAGNTNYNPASQTTQSFSIGLGSQTISFGTAPTLVVGGTGTVSATGGASGNAVTFNSTTTSVCTTSGTNGSTVTGVTAGSCIIAANQAGNANYNPATQTTQSFTIGKGNQTISFGAAPTVVVGGIGTVSATGGASGNPVTFSSTTTSVCTTSGTNGSTVSGLTIGTCIIAANQAGNANYNAAPQATLTFSIVASPTASYSVTDLGTLGGTLSEAFAINNSGQVVGMSELVGSTTSHAFMYSGGVMNDLGSLGGTVSWAYGINDGGQVVGYSLLANNSQHAFYYSGGVMNDLGSFGGSTSTASGINKSGQIVGSFVSSTIQHAFLYVGGSMNDLGNLGGSNGSYAFGINNSGQIVGMSYLADNVTQHPFLYSGGVMSDLGTLGGHCQQSNGFSLSCQASGINTSGQIVGWSNLADNATTHAFLYSGGVMRDLGSLGGSSDAFGINDNGQIVGYSGLAGNTTTHAFIYSGGVMSDLNALLTSNTAGWVLYEAMGINNVGQIVGYGSNNNGSIRAFLLTPTILNQTITFGSAPTVVVGGTGTVSATGGASGNPVTFSSTTTSVCTTGGTNGSTVTGVAAGTCTIAANQAGNASYSAAPQATLTFIIGAQSAILFQENFDSYALNTFPTGWSLVYNGAGTADQYVDNTEFVSPPQSLHLVGSSCWSANAYHTVPFPTPLQKVSVTAKVYLNQIVTGGCGPDLAGFAIDNPSLGSFGTGYGYVYLYTDGYIYAFQKAGDRNYDVKIMPYQTNTWYTIRTDLDFVQNTFDVYVNGTPMATGLKMMDTGTPTGVNVVAGHGNNPTAWFDDVVVSAINVESQSISFNVVPPTLSVDGSGTVSATGGASGNPVKFSSMTPLVCSTSGANGSTVTGMEVGTCIIAADQAGDVSYSPASEVQQIISVGKGIQTIVFGPMPIVSVGSTGTVTAQGGPSAFPVVFSSQTQSICTVNGNTVTGLAVGTCIIAANQSGDANFLQAPQVASTFSIIMGNQAISFGAAPTVVVGGTGTVSATGGASGNPVTFASTTTGVCTISGSTVTGVTAGTCTIAANQVGNANYNAAPQVSQSFTIGKGNQTISFGAAPTVSVGGTGTVSATGGATGNPVTFISTTTNICTVSGSTVTGKAVGSCTINANQAGNANYNAAPQATLTFNIGIPSAILFQDKFDSYALNTFPTGWTLVYDGAGTGNQYVDNTHFVSPSQSLHLVGSSCWSSEAFHPVTFPVTSFKVSVTAKVFIDQIVSAGCDSALASFSVKNPNQGTWGTGYGEVYLGADGNLYAIQSAYNRNYDVKIMPYKAKTWYTIRSDVDFAHSSFDVYVNGTPIVTGLKIMDTGFPTGITVEADHGNNPTVWFDDVVVSYPTNDLFFNWAEANYPALFAPTGTVTKFSAPYTYRYYTATNAYLAVSSADNHVYYMGPDQSLLDEGTLYDWLPQAGYSVPSPTDCLFNWAEENYPGLFAPSESFTTDSTPYTYRYYSTNNAYLGVSSADNHVYYMGPDGILLNEGPESNWLPKAGCQ